MLCFCPYPGHFTKALYSSKRALAEDDHGSGPEVSFGEIQKQQNLHLSYTSGNGGGGGEIQLKEEKTYLLTAFCV